MRILLFLFLLSASDLIAAPCDPNVMLTKPITDPDWLSPVNNVQPVDNSIDNFKINGLRISNDLSIHDGSKYGQSEYPGCNDINKYPTQCRTTTSIVGQHVYAQRFFFTNNKQQPNPQSKYVISATTNDSMRVEEIVSADYMGLVMAISEKAGEFNTEDPNCTTINVGARFHNLIRIIEDHPSNKDDSKNCKLKLNYMYYINVKPFGGKTADCGITSVICNFSVYHNILTVSYEYKTNPSVVLNFK